MYDPRSKAPVDEWFRAGLVMQSELHLFTQSIEWPALEAARELAVRVARSTDRVRLRVHNVQESPAEARRAGVDQIPCFVPGPLDAARRRYVGAPSGRLYANLLSDLIDTSRGDTRLRSDSLESLRRQDPVVSIQVFADRVSPHAAQMARLAHQFAFAAPGITAETIVTEEFPDLADSLQVRAIPTVTLNGGETRVEGALPESSFLAQVLRIAEEATNTGEFVRRGTGAVRAMTSQVH
ncbi:MAG TPA: thioredoxin family protein [Thermoplasmata archaeon]|nr:thioredoxin family protein [Thermoplasmata archaeon]